MASFAPLVRCHMKNHMPLPRVGVGSGTETRDREEGLVYFERFLGLDDVAVLISGAPIRFTACDFSCDSAPAAQMRPHC